MGFVMDAQELVPRGGPRSPDAYTLVDPDFCNALKDARTFRTLRMPGRRGVFLKTRRGQNQHVYPHTFGPEGGVRCTGLAPAAGRLACPTDGVAFAGIRVAAGKTRRTPSRVSH